MGLMQIMSNELNSLRKTIAEWRSPISWLLTVIALFAAALFFARRVHTYLNDDLAVELLALMAAGLFSMFAVGLIVMFFVAFKGINADEKRLDRAITYCYVFVIFSLFGSMLPFLFLPHVPTLTKIMRVSPIGVVRGCSVQAKQAKIDFVPIELRCNGITNQWVVNLGGVVWSPGIPATRSDVAPEVVAGASNPPAAAPAPATVAAIVPAAASGSSSVPKITTAALPASLTVVHSTPSTSNSSSAPAVATAATPAATAGPLKRSVVRSTESSPSALAATTAAAGGGVARSSAAASTDLPLETDMNVIQGGLVIPLYVVVLSLMGASVSMTRRVPEYQRRLSPKDPDFMSYDQAREALVFQVMQVFSAPLIAVTMYYLIEPGSRATTILLAFASGFSSETILLFIRAFLEKIKPVTTPPTRAATNIIISPARLDFGKTPVGTPVSNTIAIVNPTAVDLEVMSISCTGTGEFSVPANFSKNIGAGKSVLIQLTFAPKSVGTKNGVFTVTDNAPGSPRAIDVFGEGV